MYLPLYDTLKLNLERASQELNLVLGIEGETFIPPLNPHVRAQISYGPSHTVSLGESGLIRSDGDINLRLVCNAAKSSALIRNLARQMVGELPRGTRLICQDGEIVLMTAQYGAFSSDSNRQELQLTIPFYLLHENLST